MNILKKIQSLKGRTPLSIIIAILSRIPSKLFMIDVLYAFRLTKAPSTRFHKNTQIQTQLISQSDLSSINTSKYKQKLFLKRILSGELCIIARINGDIVGYEWFTTSRTHYEERYHLMLDIPNNALYGYDAFIFPGQRKRGALRCIIQHAFSILEVYNKSEIISYVGYENDVSLHVHKYLGFHKGEIFALVSILKFSYFLKLPKCLS